MTRIALALLLSSLLSLGGSRALAQQDREDPTDAPVDAPVDRSEGEGGGGGAMPTDPEEEALPLAAQPSPAPTDAARDEAPIDEGALDEAPLDEGALDEQEPAPSRLEASADVERAAPGLDACATDSRGRPIGPLQVGSLDGNLGVPHRACARQELALGGDALLVAHTSEFYGNIRASGRARISAPIPDSPIEGFLEWEALRYQTVISAVAAEYLGLGYLSFGARGQVLREDGRVLAVSGRMVLPTTSGLDQSSQPLALDLGVTAGFLVDPSVRFHLWLNLIGSVGIGAGPPEPRGGVRAGGGVDLRAAEWISFVIELASGFGYVDALDYLAAQGGVRLAFGEEVGLELGLSFPFVGARAFDDGALPIAAELMLSWRMP